MTMNLLNQKEVNGLDEQPDYLFKLSGGAVACMVNSEIGAVLAVMRRNVRWGVHYASDDEQIEHSLIISFKELRKKIFSWQKHWHTIDPVLYLQPFLDVIKSDETGAPITGVALSSVYKILNLQILDSKTVNVDNALHLIVDAVTSCRFEVTDPASEEVVLMKILQVLLACMKNKASVSLNNHHVCSIVNTCFRIVHQASSKSELLQRISRHTMHELVRCIFSHLPDLGDERHDLDNGNRPSPNIEVTEESHFYVAYSDISKNENAHGKDSTSSADSSMMDPYGVPAMVEIFHFLCSLLNVMENIEVGPRSNPIAYHEDVPLFALGLINSAIELGGVYFGNHPKLLALIQEELFYNLMQFGSLCLSSSYMPIMIVIISCSNVFEGLANLLSRLFSSEHPFICNEHLALDGLTALVQGMAERIGHDSSSLGEASLELEEYNPFWTVRCDDYGEPLHWVPFVHNMKNIKKKLMIGVDHFNRDPKKGLEFLQGLNLLPDNLDPKSVACFFRTFDFRDMNLDTALRIFLDTFRLPGESQKIQRVLEAFAESYFEQAPNILANKDAALLLSYSLIMLNTDQHKRTEQEDVLQSCIDGFLAIAKLSASYNLNEVLDDLIVSLCKFTTLLHPSFNENSILYFGDDTKAKMATVAVFTIANRYSDHIRLSWRNILDCILSLQKIGLLPARRDANELESSPDNDQVKTSATPHQHSEEELAARQRTLQTIQNCHIDSIFAESKFLQAESLSQLVRALVVAARRPLKGNTSLEDEDTAVFCLELLIAITLNNRDRIMLLWQNVYEHIASVVQSTVMPCALVEKAVFGLLRICQRLLPYKENLTDELLKSLQLVLKLDARVADAYCEPITQEVMHLVKANAMQIRSHMGWRTIISLLSITARHPEASESGFETLSYIMSEGAHLSPANYVLCVNAARQFAESRVGHVDRSVKSLDLMAGSVVCLVTWFHQTKEAAGEEAAVKMSQDILEMWMRLVQSLRKVCVDHREEVRNHAIVLLQRCLTGVEGIRIPTDLWLQCFDLVIFTLLDELPELAQQQSPKDYRSMEGSMIFSLKLLSKTFLQTLHDLSQSTSFCQLWLKVLGCMEKYMKMRFRGKRSEKIHELLPELLKNTLLVMKTSGILVPSDPVGGDSFWQLGCT
ncbi:UNVERIFIED_CONTAM: ARF guanine-nucleotide exchange factor GNOM [Sesamum latifolium]|uniref:ARF guanine-nucleotide exchange factor GNOM n=1 Tax=Sesamum latifolium TaxID=2727402 RepID=A0AAW2X9R5_9LAMI